MQVDTISEPQFKSSQNRPVDLINLNFHSVIIRLVIVERLGWRYNNKVINSSEKMCIMSKSIDQESRLRRSLWRSLSSIPVWHEQNGLEHKKLCLNLCSWRSLNSTRSRVRSLIPMRSCMLNIDLLEGLIRNSNLFLKSDMVVHKRSEETSSRFHSLTQF